MDKFRKGDIVWAKVVGFPWWPGKITYIYYKHRRHRTQVQVYDDHPSYTVDFYGDHSTSDILKAKLENFIEKFEDYSQCKRPSLIRAISEAKKAYIEDHKNLPPKILFNVLGKKRYRVKKPEKKRRKKWDSASCSQDEFSESRSKSDNEAESLCEDSRQVDEQTQNNALLQIRNLIEDLIKCKVEVRRSQFVKKTLNDIDELSSILKKHFQFDDFESVSHNYQSLFYFRSRLLRI